MHATIDFFWNDGKRTLTIGKRQGAFPGMPKKQVLNAVVVKPGRGVGFDASKRSDKVVHYDGREAVVRL